MNELKDTQEDLLSGLVDLGLLGSVKEGLSLGSETGGCAVLGKSLVLIKSEVSKLP